MDSPNDVYGGAPPSQGPRRNPWVAVGATAVVAVVIAAGVAASSGDAGAGPTGGGPGVPTLPPGGKYTAVPSLPADGPGRGPTRTPTRTPTAKPTKNDWNSATGDTTVFTAAEWFPETGVTTLGGNTYNHLLKRDGSCSAAEPKMRKLMSSTCVKVIQSLWTNSGKTQIGALSVVSLRDKAAADSLQSRLAGDDSDGQYINYLTPPSGSGVSTSKLGPTWVSTTVTGHYLVIAEAGRVDGKPIDADTRAMVNDMREKVMEYARTVDG